MTVEAQTDQTPGAEALQVVMTPAAVAEAKAMMEQEGRNDLRVRLAVMPGGCRGMSYDLYFDDELQDGDLVRSFDGVELVIDPASNDKLAGASIDYVKTLAKSSFTIDNPNAQASCACGDSFC